MLRSPNQTANQIHRSYKNDQSNIFVTVYFMTRKYNHNYTCKFTFGDHRVYVIQFCIGILSVKKQGCTIL